MNQNSLQRGLIPTDELRNPKLETGFLLPTDPFVRKGFEPRLHVDRWATGTSQSVYVQPHTKMVRDRTDNSGNFVTKSTYL